MSKYIVIINRKLYVFFNLLYVFDKLIVNIIIINLGYSIIEF